MLFSIAVIARNEAETLPRLLASLTEFQNRGGEVVLVDTGSTDGTPDIARAAGCRVFEAGERFMLTIDAPTAELLNRTFIVEGEEPIIRPGDRTFDFASARNYAASLTTHDFVAMPDCDEIYAAFDLDAVNELLRDPTLDQIDSMYVFSRDQWGNDAIKFSRSRFYHRRRMHWVGLQHECLAGLEWPKRILVDESVIRLEHWQNTATDRGQYLIGLALDCHLHPDNDRNSHYFGRELLFAHRTLSAIRELERHIAMNGWVVERGQSLIFIGDAYGLLHREQDQLDAYWRSFQTDSSRRAALLRLARHYFRKGDAQRTACFAAASLQVEWQTNYANCYTDYTSYPHELLYWAKWRLRDIAGAREHWKKALDFQPHNTRCLADARYFMPTPPVAVLVVVDGDAAPPPDIDEKAIYPEFEVIVHHQDPGTATPIAEVLKAMLPLTTSDYVLFLEAGHTPGPGFLIHAMLTAQQDLPYAAGGLVFLRDTSGLASRACWLAPKSLLLPAIEATQSSTRVITELLPIGTPYVVSEHATVGSPPPLADDRLLTGM